MRILVVGAEGTVKGLAEAVPGALAQLKSVTVTE